MSEPMPDLHPEHQDIEEAARMHAAYYNALVHQHNIPQDHAAGMTEAFIELAFKDDN